jgi:hypothetical protein
LKSAAPFVDVSATAIRASVANADIDDQTGKEPVVPLECIGRPVLGRSIGLGRRIGAPEASGPDGTGNLDRTALGPRSTCHTVNHGHWRTAEVDKAAPR